MMSRRTAGLGLGAAAAGAFGLSRLFAEVVAASNLDRGLFVADPIVTGVSIRHFGWHVGAFHVSNRYGIYALRVDAYNPNADFFDSRAGKLLPTEQTITTVSPLVGMALGERFRLTAQYDFVSDNLARDARGVPTDLRNNRFTLRLQADL